MTGPSKRVKEWMKQHGLSGRDARRCVTALGTLADLEGQLKSVATSGNFDHAHADVCSVLRKVADAWEFDEL